MLRRNGTLLYAVDAVEGRDNAFELVDDGVGKRVEIHAGADHREPSAHSRSDQRVRPPEQIASEAVRRHP
jgi:hypothetical protein